MTNCCIQKIRLSCSFVQYNCVLFMLHCKSVHKLCTESNVEARSRNNMNARSQTLNEKKTLLYAERASGFFLPRDNCTGDVQRNFASLCDMTRVYEKLLLAFWQLRSDNLNSLFSPPNEDTWLSKQE